MNNNCFNVKKEYGGFLPLELNLGGKQPYYYKYHNNLAFNTVKAAFPLLGKLLQSEQIYVPYYLCPNVIKELEKSFYKVSFYNIDKTLLPIIDKLKGKTVYLVNYFGIMDKAIAEYVLKNEDTTFLIDNAHSFYNKPIMRDNVYNLYSCKKFFGVPDGGYLISKKKVEQIYSKSFSNPIANYLIKCLEEGTNSCYWEKKAVDEYINGNYSGISIFAEKLLSRIDYETIKNIRKRNFNIYQNNFKETNQIECEECSIPYIYPLNVGKNIKEKLIAERIYVPTLWSQSDKINKYEIYLSENTIFLPVDQRYNPIDIYYICKVVKNLLEDN